MATAPTKLLTAAEFLDFVNRPENEDKRLELVRGEVVEMPRPGKQHGLVRANVTTTLVLYARQRGKGYVCSNDTGVLVERDPDTVRGPDVLFYDDAEDFDQVNPKWADKPSLLAVDVMSPNDTVSDLNERISEQLNLGTPLVWLFDPDAKKVTVYRPGKIHYVRKGDEELTGEDVLPGFSCKVSEFFKLPGR